MRIPTGIHDTQGHPASGPVPLMPDSFFARHPCQEVLCASVFFGVGWSGRFFLLDPAPARDMGRELHFLRALLREVAPALFGVYLIGRLRSRVGAAERARVAREIHDGAIQSLIAMELKLKVLGRKLSSEESPVVGELERVQELLHSEVLNLRELAHQIRPVEVGPRDLADTLASITERFQRETGISARFVSEVQDADVPPRLGRELVRILQEALINVRKHSGAKNVLVSFGTSQGRWKLSIEDDGRGFDFAGRRELVELDTLRCGPLVIKERTRLLGGHLAIESMPGTGSRLEVSVPQGQL